MKYRINIGCGRAPTKDWKNFDNSFAIKLANSKIIYWIVKSFGLINEDQRVNIEWHRENKINFADASKKIPLKNLSVECIYTSHMLEHLTFEGAKFFLKEALRVLEKGGVIRIVVPDIKIAIKKYLETEDANAFFKQILVTAPPIDNFKQKILLLLLGYRHHQWLYDGKSLSNLMTEAGFKKVFVCEPGKTKIPDPGYLNLYERIEDSVYVEGIK